MPLGQVPRRIDRYLILGLSTDQVVDRLPRVFSQQIPQGQVDATYHLDRGAFAAIEHRGTIHLLPDLLDIHRVPSHQKRVELRFDNRGREISFGATHRAEAVNPAVRFNLNYR